MELRTTGSSRSYCHSNQTSAEEEIQSILRSSLRRIHSWPTPRNWSRYDWYCETEEIAMAAAWQAAAEYSSPNSVALSYFVQQRVISCARTRYRQEYLYGLRFSIELSEDGDTRDHSPKSVLSREVEAAIQPLAYGDLDEAIGHLSAEQRHVIDQLFRFDHTEVQLAATLGISQPAVNKRKQAALRTLRNLLQEM